MGSSKLKDRYQKIGEIKKEIAEADKQIKNLELEQTTKNSILINLRTQVAEQNRIINNLLGLKIQQEGQIESLNRQITELETCVKTQQRTLNKNKVSTCASHLSGIVHTSVSNVPACATVSAGPSLSAGSSVSVGQSMSAGPITSVASTCKSMSVGMKSKARRAKKLSSSKLSPAEMRRRRNTTWNACMSIHGGDEQATLYGVLNTLSYKFNAAVLAPKFLDLKEPIKQVLKNKMFRDHNMTCYLSVDNIHRSLNIYYAAGVLGKKKYIEIRRANRKKKFHSVNMVPWSLLSQFINSIDIGELIPIEGNLDMDLTDEEKGSGMYRNLRTFLPQLAEFYLKVNPGRVDKLKRFDSVRSDTVSHVRKFLVAIGGDEAPKLELHF